jgi:hypothetical protein
MLADPSLRQAAGDNFLDVVKAGAGIRGQQLNNIQSLAGVNQTLRTQFGQAVGALRTDPDVLQDTPDGRQKVKTAIDQFAQSGGPDAQRIASIYGPIVEHAPQGKLARGLSNTQLQVQSAESQAANQKPSYLGTGGSNVQVNPQAAGANPAAPAPNLPNTLAPQVATDAAGNLHFLGGGGNSPASGGALRVPGPGGSQPWVNRPAAEAQGSTATDMTTHFAGLNASAQSLPIATALTKTIQSLAPDAFTGVGGDKRQYIAGLANAFGIHATGDSQTDTNLLNKAIAQLNISTPAGTDAARALVEAGQPNSKMDPQAIREAAGTIAGQVRMNVAERNYLNNIRYANGGAGDPAQYQQARQQFEANADPRIWQYEELKRTDPDGAKKFIQRQPDIPDLAKKARTLEQAGIFK